MTTIKKCLFPLAGFGTLLPSSQSSAGNASRCHQTLIQYGVEEAMSAMISDMAFVTGKNKRAIEDHFDINYELENAISGTEKETQLESTRSLINNCSFVYKRQTEMLGLGHAILISQSMIGVEPFAVILPDDLCFGSELSVIGQMVKLYEQYNCSIIAIDRARRKLIVME